MGVLTRDTRCIFKQVIYFCYKYMTQSIFKEIKGISEQHFSSVDEQETTCHMALVQQSGFKFPPHACEKLFSHIHWALNSSRYLLLEAHVHHIT